MPAALFPYCGQPLSEARFHARAGVWLDDTLFDCFVDGLVERGDVTCGSTLPTERLFEVSDCIFHGATTAQIDHSLAKRLAMGFFC